MVRAAFLRMKTIYTWRRGVKNLFKIRGSILGIGSLILAKYTKGYVRGIMVLLLRIEKLRKSQGLRGALLYLKACTILVIKFIAKDPTPRSSTTYGPHVSLTRRKIPRIIPLVFRKRIVRGDRRIIQLVLTILGLYRVLPFYAPLKTDTITDVSLCGDIPEDFKKWLKPFLSTFVRVEIKDKFNPFFISSAGNRLEHPTDPFGLFWQTLVGIRKVGLREQLVSCAYWFHSVVSLHARGLLPPLVALLKLYPQSQNSLNMIKVLSLVNDKTLKSWSESYSRVASPSIGRLSLKIEPGKVRVFAIVDTLTQWALKPLHNGLFAWLKRVPTDATFDQNYGLKVFFSKMRPGERVFSYDLSAATDRLPIKLQILILNSVFNNKMGDLWANLLVNRTYYLGSFSFKVSTTVRYLCGQPMGAYSSWAMLALTHHIIIQFAAFKAYRKGIRDLKWFNKYCILGDDIIIGDPTVAEIYYDFMVNTLKVKINLAKSVISNNGIGEFAKRITNGTEDFSPLSLKEFESWGKVSGSFIETLRRFPDLSIHNILRVLGKGSRSAGHFNKLYHMVKLLKPLLNPDVSPKEKIISLIGGPQAEDRVKYILWSMLWNLHGNWAENNAKLMWEFHSNNYDKKLSKLWSIFEIPYSLRIYMSSFESSNFFKTMLFGFTPSKAEALHEKLLIRLKPYNEVSIEELLWVLDEDFNSLIGPNILVDNSFEFLFKTNSSKVWKANFEKIEKFVKFYHFSLTYFANDNVENLLK